MHYGLSDHARYDAQFESSPKTSVCNGLPYLTISIFYMAVNMGRIRSGASNSAQCCVCGIAFLEIALGCLQMHSRTKEILRSDPKIPIMAEDLTSLHRPKTNDT